MGYSVYAHIFENGKVYVGITKGDVRARWKNGKGYGKHQPIMKNAINKYGWDNIKHIVVYEGLTQKDACIIEKHFITDLQLFNIAYGYNATLGGETNEPTEQTRKKRSAKNKALWQETDYRERAISGMTGKRRSDISRANISKAQKKRFEDTEQRKHISDVQKGKTRSEKAKKKTSDSLRLFYSNEENRKQHAKDMAVRNQCHNKSVKCLETGKTYKSVSEAAKDMGLTHQNLSACLQGKRKTFGGYHWEFCKEYKNVIIRQNIQTNKKQGKR